MMTDQEFIQKLIEDFKDKVCESISVKQQGIGRMLVETPFTFQDGDSYVIVLNKQGGSWVFTDEGHTLMHLSYWMENVEDISVGNRKEIVDGILSSHFMRLDENGEMQIEVHNNDFGNSLFTFIQGITNIMDLTFLTRERVKSTFLEDFEKFMKDSTPPEKLMRDWNEPSIDTNRNYTVPYYLPREEGPIFVFPVDNENRVKDANITLLFFQTKQYRNQSIIVFEDMGEIYKKPLARLVDVGGKLFSNFESNKEMIKEYIKLQLEV